jgi:outer membrane lipoprotein-sorting protein
MGKIKKRAVLFLALFCAALLPFPRSVQSASPNAEALIAMAFNNPTQAYQGQMLVSYWTETGSKAEDVKIYFIPPNKYRFEFLRPNGTVDRVVLSDGARQNVQQLDKNSHQNLGTTSSASLLTPEEEKKLLLSNYKASVKESEKLLGRPTWTVELIPLVAGKPYQLVRIDQATHVMLESKRYIPEGKTGSITRFTHFEPGSSLPRDSFLPDIQLDQSTKKDGIETSTQELSALPTNEETSFSPAKLYGGFCLEGSDQFDVNGKLVKHSRYTDGLFPISLFQTPLPVKAPTSEKKQLIEWSRPLQMGTTNTGNIYQWKKDEEYFTLIGDAQPSFLQEIARNLK